MQSSTHAIIRGIFLQAFPLGVCTCGNDRQKFYNIGKTHWIACEKCKTRWTYGGNLFSSWRHESENDWRENWDRFHTYREISGMELLDDFDTGFITEATHPTF